METIYIRMTKTETFEAGRKTLEIWGYKNLNTVSRAWLDSEKFNEVVFKHFASYTNHGSQAPPNEDIIAVSGETAKALFDNLVNLIEKQPQRRER